MDADRTSAVLASIDGALADEDLRDGMRWSPQPEQVEGAPAPFDGVLVWQPPQSYERSGSVAGDSLPGLLEAARADAERLRAARDERDRRLAGAVRRTAHIVPPSPEEAAEANPRVAVPDPPDMPAPADGLLMAAAMEAAARQLTEAIGQLAEEVTPAWRDMGESMRAAGIALTSGLPRPGPVDRAEVFSRALAAKQDGLLAGPRRPGPEQGRRPRRHQ